MSKAQVPEGSPFHAGEVAVQTRLGVRDTEDWARKTVRPSLSEQQRVFFAQLPFLVAAARDAEGRPWITLLTGPKGFATSPDPEILRIAARPAMGDALEHAIVEGADLGLLGIDLAQRRRTRVNGRVKRRQGLIVLAVDQTFGNCPQYIHPRAWERVADHQPGPPRRGDALTEAQRALIAKADTLFIASGFRGRGEDPRFGMDASHRGGDPGFVEVVDGRRLWFPDYAGNNYFNTIGNLTLDPRVGLTFMDFETGSLVQITGRATIDWDSEAVRRVPGAKRLVVIDVDEVVDLPRALPLRWSGAATPTAAPRTDPATPAAAPARRRRPPCR